APNMAMASKPVARATVLLMFDVVLACCSSSIDVITVVVSGATVIAMPMPSVKSPGKYDVQYDAPPPRNARSANPQPATIGPTVSSGRGPMRSASAPVQRESSDIVATIGRNAAPADAGV